ncbi:MAG: hypothetical protein U1E89_15075 [Burkholderiaceae bacterium]
MARDALTAAVRPGLIGRRRLLAGTALAPLPGLFGLAGCGGGGDGGGAASGRSVRITNSRGTAIESALSINGKPLVRTNADLLREAAADIPTGVGLHPQRAFALGLWRFLVRNRWYADPLTEQQWAHSPVIFLNSVGFGYCDDVASVYADLARTAGYEARVWGLQGHVVPELRVDGRWEMYDPDLEVYYLNAAGLPAGVDELASNPKLILEPLVGRAVPTWASELRGLTPELAAGQGCYQPWVADIYTSVGDNSVEPWYDDIPYAQPAGVPLQLPPGASATIGRLGTPWLRTMYDTSISAQGALRLTLPAGTTARLTLPLVPLRMTGSGTVALDDLTAAVGSRDSSARLADFSSPVIAIEVQRATSQIEIEYLLNDARFGLDALRDVQLGSVPGGSVSVQYLSTALA